MEAGHRRPDQPLVGRRGRRRRLEPRRRLHRHGREPSSAATSSRATASTSRPTAARPGRTSASTETQAIAKIRVHPDQPRPRLRRGVRPSRRRRIPSAASSGRRTAARRGRRFSSATTRPARIELVLDPKNPQVLYAALWEAFRNVVRDVERRPRQRPLQVDRRRRPLDRDLAQPGLPKGDARQDRHLRVAAPTRNRVYAQIEAEDGGFFLSDDAGATWKKVNERPRPPPARVLLLARLRRPEGEGHRLRAERQHLQVDRRRQDAGRPAASPHGDNHDMWIAPNDPNRMIEANDGGANVSINGGETWTDRDDADGAVLPRDHDQARAVSRLRRAAGQPHGVRVEPGRRRAARADRAAAPIRCSTRSAAARAATSRSDPRNPDIFYAGSYGGLITRLDQQHRPGARRSTRIPTTRWATRRPTSPSASSGRSRS